MNKQEIFLTAILDNNVIKLKELVNEPDVDMAYEDNRALHTSASSGRFETVKFLISLEQIKPESKHNLAIRVASRKGHLNIVELLLNDSRVDPSDFSNSAIRCAEEYGHTEIIEILIKNKRIRDSLKIEHLFLFNKVIKYYFKEKIEFF
jgi:hypothetical protein